MKHHAFAHIDQDRRRRGQRGVFLAALCVCAVAALAMSALLPGEGLPRKVAGEPYDEGAFAYAGTLRGGRFSGHGRIAFAGGGSYEGGFSEGRFDGQGVFASAEGWAFEGAFSEGKPVRGVLHTPEGDIEADPESGIYAVDGGWRYMGLLGVNGPRGQGEFTFADGAVYRGAFSGGLPGGGQGTYTDAAGVVVYTGGWQDGLFSGEGEYNAPDGSFAYKGSFAGGRFHGQGALTRRDGATLAGTWKGGWRIKP
ncbi:MAG: hypothetical protein LBB75_02040 [Oscillospiraceae bacterium]|jgi:hypothetical protein|nr:hypothetical protein [Oscillospiraceae bacterium]